MTRSSEDSLEPSCGGGCTPLLRAGEVREGLAGVPATAAPELVERIGPVGEATADDSGVAAEGLAPEAGLVGATGLRNK